MSESLTINTHSVSESLTINTAPAIESLTINTDSVTESVKFTFSTPWLQGRQWQLHRHCLLRSIKILYLYTPKEAAKRNPDTMLVSESVKFTFSKRTPDTMLVSESVTADTTHAYVPSDR